MKYLSYLCSQEYHCLFQVAGITLHLCALNWEHMFDIFAGSEPPKWSFCSSKNVCPSRRRWSLRFYDRNWYSFWMQAPKYCWTSWSILQWWQTLGKMNFCINSESIYSFCGTKIRFLNCHNLKTKSDWYIAAIVIQVIPNFLVCAEMWFQLIALICAYINMLSKDTSLIVEKFGLILWHFWDLWNMNTVFCVDTYIICWQTRKLVLMQSPVYQIKPCCWRKSFSKCVVWTWVLI